ncbi:hypothetical protein ACFL08_05745 [Patescibacteria group bacterium]
MYFLNISNGGIVMDPISALFVFFLEPIGFWWAMSWWVIAPSTLCFVISIASMADYDDRHDGVSGVALLIAFALVSLGSGYASEVEGFWVSLLEAGKFFVKFFLIYVGCGIVTLFPLWYVNVRRIAKRNKENFDEFVNDALEGVDRYGNKFKTPLTDEQKIEVENFGGVKDGKMLPCLRKIMNEYGLIFKSTNARDNLDIISSLIFLWPIHILIETFGEFIVKIPERVARLLRVPLNWISKIATRGMPDEIK